MGTAILQNMIPLGYLSAAVCYILHFPGKQARIGRYATGLLIAAFVGHSIFLIDRTRVSGHLPFVGLHESMSFYAWLLTIVYLILEFRFRDKSLGAFVVPLIMTAQAVAVFGMSPEDPLPEVLRSAWFSVHVTASFFGYAAFFFAFITALLYVLQLYYLHARRVGVVFSRLPSLEMLDDMNLKATSIGWVFLTIGIATGIMWAEQVWSSILPWTHDVKVFCVTLTWVIYAAQLGARYAVGWQGRRSAYLSIIGFASVLVAYLGAGLWTELHIF